MNNKAKQLASMLLALALMTSVVSPAYAIDTNGESQEITTGLLSDNEESGTGESGPGEIGESGSGESGTGESGSGESGSGETGGTESPRDPIHQDLGEVDIGIKVGSTGDLGILVSNYAAELKDIETKKLKMNFKK